MHFQNILFLQGPLGPFFKDLARALSASGYITHKINFNAGDRLYSWADLVQNYAQGPDQWRGFLHNYLVEHDIDAVFVFGDCRLYHRYAKEVCNALGVRFLVFEEGYLRPDTVTLEEGGVNAQTSLRLDQLAQYDVHKCQPAEHIGPTMKQRTLFASCYYVAACLMQKQFPEYQHHRAFGPVTEGMKWMRGATRKYLNKAEDRWVGELVEQVLDQKFFLVPLQVHDDSQMIYHSPYDSVEAFIEEVMVSFAGNGGEGRSLVIKHHPMDRGYTNYSGFISQQAEKLGISSRVLYCHDTPLPLLYKHCLGVVTVNSTVGISALHHKIPVKIMGSAFFDLAGLTSQNSLNSFWQEPQPVNPELFKKLRTMIFKETQINGSFFKQRQLTCKNVIKFIEDKLGVTPDPVMELSATGLPTT